MMLKKGSFNYGIVSFSLTKTGVLFVLGKKKISTLPQLKKTETKTLRDKEKNGKRKSWNVQPSPARATIQPDRVYDPQDGAVCTLIVGNHILPKQILNNSKYR